MFYSEKQALIAMHALCPIAEHGGKKGSLMCGIVGIVDLREKNATDKTELKKMLKPIRYRGPDQEGFFIGDFCGFGHCRLSIIDLSERARQPLFNEDGTIVIVFNGEIYNFRELRVELERKGHTFSSNSDTEVIIHLYEEYDANCVDYINGMFAFAIWDSKKQELFIARDRSGKKPLFYYYCESRFVFASELKAILQIEKRNLDIDFKAIPFYLTFGYIPAPYSIYSEIKKLNPGHYLILSKKGLEIKEYWDLKFEPHDMNEDYCCRKILQLLEESTKLRMISDVPLGVFLSGGIDSSAVVAMASKVSDEAVKTFSIGFRYETFNELEYAREVSESFGTEHKELTVEADSIGILPKIIWLYNEPYADSSAIPSYYVSLLAKKYVTVALNGDGGDENFAGYNRYAALYYRQKYLELPKIVHRLSSRVTGFLPKTTTRWYHEGKLKKLVSLGQLSEKEAYMLLTSYFDLQRRDKGLLSGSMENGQLMPYFNQFFEKYPILLNRMLYTDIKTYLPYDLLVKMDIATMANSMEARSPFLDYVFMEFCATIPPEHKLKNGHKKYILIKALSKILPRHILRRRKHGFSIPLEFWLKKDLASLCEDVLASPSMKKRGLSIPFLNRLIANHRRSPKEESAQLWNLLCLEFWFRTYYDREDVSKPLSVEELFCVR